MTPLESPDAVWLVELEETVVSMTGLEKSELSSTCIRYLLWVSPSPSENDHDSVGDVVVTLEPLLGEDSDTEGIAFTRKLQTEDQGLSAP